MYPPRMGGRLGAPSIVLNSLRTTDGKFTRLIVIKLKIFVSLTVSFVLILIEVNQNHLLRRHRLGLWTATAPGERPRAPQRRLPHMKLDETAIL